LSELRLILLGLGLLAIGAIWWWSARRSGQAAGNAELRESTAAAGHPFGPSIDESASSERRAHATEMREWGVPPLEPLNIRTADMERVPALDQPMTAFDPIEIDIVLPPTPAIDGPLATAPLAATPPRAPAARDVRSSIENGDRLAAVPPPGPDTTESQKILTVRVCAVGETRWSGAAVMAALEVHGLAYGRFQVYHRNHSDGRSIFCVASLTEPGTFDVARMAEEEFRGLTLFAVLPGPIEPLQTVDALLATARELSRELLGTVQDTKGMPFSPQRVAALREDVARFQAQLH
jgi:cell division protein ZipA